MSKEKNSQSYINKEQDRRLRILEDRWEKTATHIARANEELAVVKTDVSWLKRHYWIVVTASVGALIGALINLVS